MRPMALLALAALLLPVQPMHVHAQTPSPLPPAEPAAVGLSPTGLAEVGALLDAFVREGRVAGAVVAVARRGSLAYLHTTGVQDVETGTPMSEGSLFRIYSMAKPVTAVAAMMLHEEGHFQLDDPVSRYLPEFSRVRVAEQQGRPWRAPAREITVRDLLLHTSGLSHRTSALYTDLRVRRRDIPMRQFLDNVVAAPLMEDPGTLFRYSEGTTVVGALIEVWSGQRLDDFLEERIFRPLGMSDTGFWVRPEQRGRLATVHVTAPEGGLVPYEIEDVPVTVRPALLEGAVGLVSTVSDFVRFSQMLLQGGALDGVRLLPPETVQTMTRNGLDDAVLQGRPGTMGWGLGNVNVVMDPAALSYPASLGEYGWDGTAGTIFWVDPVQEMVIVLMTQSSPSNPEQLRQRVKTLVYGAIGG